MWVDDRAEFCDATALNTGGAASYLLGDVYDLGGTSQDIGNGEPLYVVISVDTAVTSGGSGTYAFKVCSDDTAAIAVDGTQTIHAQTAAIPKATLVAGYQIVLPLPPKFPLYERYLGIVQTTAVAAATAGKINAFITRNVPTYRALPNDANG